MQINLEDIRLTDAMLKHLSNKTLTEEEALEEFLAEEAAEELQAIITEEELGNERPEENLWDACSDEESEW